MAPGGPDQTPLTPAVAGQGAKSYVVVFQPNTVGPLSVTASLEQRHGIRNVRHRYERAIQGFAADLTPAQLNAIAADPRVQFVEADAIFRTTATQSNPPSWGLDRIDQRNLPLSLSYTYPNGAPAVHFYGIDTGILYGHADFGGRAVAGFDAVVPANGAVDCNGHGTHTASTAAGTTYGVAKSMQIVGVRVLDCGGSGTTAGVIAGIDWVRINAIKPAVANMSLGGGFSQALNNAVANAVAAGIVFTVSAGNSNANACNASPASEPSAITVGATSNTDSRASFSNLGTCLDLFAPGVNITAAYIPQGTAVASGTSMSAPHAAGAAGLYLAANPSATPSQVAAALVNNATSGVVTNPGTGSPNKLLFMGFLNGGGTNQPPIASFTFTCSLLACNFNGSGSSDDVGIVSYSWNFGDNTTGSGVTPSHTYGSAGTYSVTLTVTDGGGLSNASTHSVTVNSGSGNQPPTANVVVTCVPGLTCTFDGRGSVDDVRVTRYEWRRQNGKVVSTAPVFSMTFESVVTRTWSLTVWDAGNLSNSKSFTFTSLP
jgi:subtilisin family serine protease